MSLLTFEQRRSGIGGSDAAAILGLNPWKSSYQLWLEKTGQTEQREPSEKMQWGNILEEPIALAFSHKTGRLISPSEHTHYHSEHKWMYAHPDRLIDPKDNMPAAILECKNTANPKLGWGEEGTDIIPAYYLIQVQHTMACVGEHIKEAFVAVLINGSDFRIYPIKRDDELIAMMIEREKAFWENHVIPGIAPEVTTDEDINHFFPKSKEASVDVSPDIQSALDTYKSNIEWIDNLEKQNESLRVSIKKHMGECSKLVGRKGETLATWKTHESSKFDTTRFKTEKPEIYEVYKKKAEVRTFRLVEQNNTLTKESI